MHRIGLVAVLLVIFAYEVIGDVCPTQAEIDRVNELARTITAMQATLPELNLTDDAVLAQYAEVLGALCTTNKTLLDELQAIVGSCPMIALQAGDLIAIKLVGKGFLEFFEEFKDVDQFCVCSPYLFQAWTFNETRSSATVNTWNGAYETTADLDVYCSETSMKTLIEHLYSGYEVCTALPKQAGLSSGALLVDIKNFITMECPNYLPDSMKCALDESVEADFKACIANPVFKSDIATKVELCGRQRCVKSMISAPCGEIAYSLYIDAVNLQRDAEQLVISTGECEEDGATVSQLSTMLALGTAILYMIL